MTTVAKAHLFWQRRGLTFATADFDTCDCSGLVVCAASGTVLFHLRGGASSLVRGGLRLVLAAFLLFVTLWAVNGFAGAFISQDDTAACQITVAFASAFDQIARVTLEEYLFWAMRRDLRLTSGLWFTQTIIFLRFVLGGIFVGVHRPHFAPICVATSLVWQIGVAVAVADAAVVFILLTRASSVGLFRDAKAGGAIGLRARGLTFTTVALGLWIPVSSNCDVMNQPIVLVHLFVLLGYRLDTGDSDH